MFAPIRKPSPSLPPQTVIDLGTTPIPLTFLAPNAVIIGTNTLSVNGQAATIHGQVVSLRSSFLVAGTRTIRLEGSRAPAFTAVINGETVTGYKASDGGIVLGSATLQPGGPGFVTGGRTISVGKTGVFLDEMELKAANPSMPTSTSPGSGAMSSSASSLEALCGLGAISLFIFTIMVAFSAF
jgi:hypothetical protein